MKDNRDATILRLQKELEERNSELLALVEACTLINSTLDVRKLVELIMDMAKKVLDAEASSLMLIDEATGELVFEVAHGEVGEKIKTIKIPPGKGIAGWVALHGEPLLIPDVSSDERFYKKADEKTNFVTRSIICAPLITKEKTLGIVEVLNKRPREGRSVNFTENDLKLLMALASQSAVALDNAILYERISAEKKKIETIVNSMRDGVVVTDRNFEVVLTNPAARGLFPDEAAAGNSNSDESPPSGAEGPYGKSHQNLKLSIILDEIKQVPIDSCQDIVLMKPEEIIISNGVTIMKDQKGIIDGSILAMRNVTGSKERDRVISEFLAITANTMNGGMARLRPILEGVSGHLPREAWKHLSEIRAGILKHLYFMELEAGPIRLDRTQTDFSEVIDNAVAHRSEAAGYRNMAFDISRIPDKYIASVDREQILHVISRSIKNSIDLSPEGTKITISLESEPDNFRIVIADSSNQAIDFECLNLPRGAIPYNILLSGGDLPRSPLEATFFRHVMDAHGGTFAFEAAKTGSGCLVSISIPKFNLV